MNRFYTYCLLLIILIVGMFYPVPFVTDSITGNYGDIYKHYYPLKHMVAEQLQAGRLPLWNPYIFAGQPLLANPQSAVFYPFSLLFWLLPPVAAFNIFFMAHIYLAGLFFFLVLKRHRLSNSASFTASIAFCFSSFLIYKIPAGHPVALSGYIWLPLVMLLASNAVREPSVPATGLLALALVYQFLSGHTFPVFITAVYLGLYAAFHVKAAARPLLTACAAAVCLSAAQLIPTFELSRASETGNWSSLAEHYSLPLKNLITFIVPGFFGNILNGTYEQAANPSYFFEKNCLYFGFLPFLLSIIGLLGKLKERRYFYPALAFTGIFLALGFFNPFYKLLYAYLPGFEYLRVPARFAFLSVTALAVLAAFAFDKVKKAAGGKLKYILLITVTAELFLWGRQFVFTQDISAYRRQSETAAMFGPGSRILTEPDTINANKSMLHHHFNLNGYEAVFLKDFTRYLGMQEKAAMNSTGLDRTDLNSPLAKGFSVGHVISTKNEPGLKLAAELKGGLKVYEKKNAMPRAYFPKKLRFIDVEQSVGHFQYLKTTAAAPQEELLLAGSEGNHVNYAPAARMISYTNLADRIFIEADVKAPSLLALSDIYYGGWKAAAGGRSFAVRRGNGVFPAIFLPEGDYTGANSLAYYYFPGSFILGVLISVSSVVAVFLLFINIYLRRPFDIRSATRL